MQRTNSAFKYRLILLLFVLTACSYAKNNDKQAVLKPLEFSYSIRRDDIKYDTLKIYNKSRETIKISKLLKGCSCTQIQYQPGPIAPNGCLEIKLTINAKGLQVKDSETVLLIKYTLDKDSAERHVPVKIRYKVLPKQEEGNVYALPDNLRLNLPETGSVKRHLVIRDNSGNAIKLQKVYTNAGNVKITRVIRRYADKYIIAIELSPKASGKEILPIVYVQHEKGLIKVPVSAMPVLS